MATCNLCGFLVLRLTAGVFGTLRPDKGAEWLDAVLEQLPAGIDRLAVAGRGWEDHAFSRAVRERYEVQLLGHIPRDELAGVFASWGIAVAPTTHPAHDGRMSVRTPLAFGVPTVATGPRDADLTLAPDHLVLSPPADVAHVDVSAFDRVAGAAQVAAFEEATVDALVDALFG